jgi:ORMDL family
MLGRSERSFAIPRYCFHSCHLRNLQQDIIIPTVNDILTIVMERQSVSRPYSDKFVAGSSDYDLFANKNVDWMSEGPFTRVFYVLAVLVLWSMVHISRAFSPQDCWTVVNIVHGVVSFLLTNYQKLIHNNKIFFRIINNDTDYVRDVTLGKRMS